MTDRHLHCVYFKWDNPNSFEGYCLLKQEKIKDGFRNHCENIILRPELVISYFLKHEGYCKDWDCADKKALEYIKRVGFNSYPKRGENK